MKVLFLTRSYSKDKGGKEVYNYNLVQELKKKNQIELIFSPSSILNVLWFYPYSLIKGAFQRNITNIHLGDNFMLPIGILLKKILNCKLSITLYGLELTYPNKLYNSLFVKPINKCDKIIAISKATKQEAVKQGISKDKISVIPCGVNPEEFKIKESKQEAKRLIEKKYNLNLKNKKVLLTVGRLVKRKGVEWFIREVFPKLNNNYAYLISGEGIERENIERAIKEKNLSSVYLLGRTDFPTLKLLYHASDIFVMPNIKVEGDMEGFGIVALESSSSGLPVVASDIEGIKDAVIQGKTGLLVKEKNPEDFIKAIRKAKSIRVNSKLVSRFSWDNVAREYGGVLG